MHEENSPKTEADDLVKIPISVLSLNELLKFTDFYVVNLPFDRGGFKNGVDIVISFQKRKYPCLYFCYSLLQPTGEYKDFEYKVDLVATACNYGGVRYWYRCPVEVLGCDRRVGTLYKGGDYFACRHCFNLTYASRNSRGPHGLGKIDLNLVCNARNPLYSRYYRGKPTKRFQRALKMDKKFKQAMAILNARWVKKAQDVYEKILQKAKRLEKKQWR